MRTRWTSSIAYGVRRTTSSANLLPFVKPAFVFSSRIPSKLSPRGPVRPIRRCRRADMVDDGELVSRLLRRTHPSEPYCNAENEKFLILS